MKILVTAFDAFGGEDINPALEGVRILPDEILGCEIIKLEIPTVFNKSLIVIEEAIKKYNPDIIISVGQAAGRGAITPERVAINIDDASILDNEDNRPIDNKIYEDGENAYFSNLPIKLIVEEIKKNDIPAMVSNSAGTFLCNHVMYGVLYLINNRYKGKRAGFIHVPCIPKQVINKPSTASMSLENITKSLEIAIKVTIENTKDKKYIGGSVC